MGEGRNPPEWTRNRNSASAIPAGYRIPERLPPIPNSPANALEIAERSNPLVRSARLHQQIAEQDGLAAAASQRPRAEAFASAGTITGQDYGGRVNELTVGGRVVVPLYDGGAARARQMQAGGQRNRAIQEERAAIQQTQNAINRVYVFLGYVDERAQNVGSRLTLQYHVFDRRWEELQAGGGNIYTSDILATVDEIYSLETEQVRLRIQKAYSHYDVLASIGTLLSSLPR
jgi:outer membrane protein